MTLYHKTENGQKVVPWFIFVWAIGFMVTLFGLGIGWTLARATTVESELRLHNEQQQIDTLTIKTQLSQIQTDILWIKQNLQK